MPINAKQPIEVPAKSFNKLWASTIEISAPSPTEEAIATIKLVPFNDQGEVHFLGSETLLVRDILSKATQNPDSNIAKAMHFLLLAIEDEYKKE